VSGGERLGAWWVETAITDITKSLPKIAWYGAGDLVAVGRLLAEISDREVTDAEAAEMGCLFYMAGKWARIAEAMKRGEAPDDDSLFDLHFYTMMIRRIRANGAWPGPLEETK
jgi:hypothetical protein